jgi:hypothetical protein
MLAHTRSGVQPQASEAAAQEVSLPELHRSQVRRQRPCRFRAPAGILHRQIGVRAKVGKGGEGASGGGAVLLARYSEPQEARFPL